MYQNGIVVRDQTNRKINLKQFSSLRRSCLRSTAHCCIYKQKLHMTKKEIVKQVRKIIFQPNENLSEVSRLGSIDPLLSVGQLQVHVAIDGDEHTL